MSWEEYGLVIEKLYQSITNYIKENHIIIDAVAPIIRSGGITGNVLAIKLGIISIIPLQLKYLRNPDRIETLIVPKQAGDQKQFKNILVCETNTVKATLAKEAINYVKLCYPESKIFYATAVKTFGGPDNLENIEEYFYGILSDEKSIATDEQIKQYNIRPKMTIFPWENIEDEIKEISQ